MTAREWLDAVEARQATAAEPLMPHWDYRQQVAWDRARSEVIKTDVLALVAALRAVMGAARAAAPEEVESSPEVAWVQGYNAAFTDIRAAIDTALGGAS